MLQVRSDQVESFQDATSISFSKSLLKTFQKEFPRYVEIEDSMLLSLIVDLLKVARALGFHSEMHAAIYAMSQWLHGFSVEEDYPDVRAVLENPLFSVDEKCQWLERWINSQGEETNS